MEAEFHRGLHEYIHFIYNGNQPAERPRETAFGIESLPGYPLPFSAAEGLARLTTVVQRLLDLDDPHAAFTIFNFRGVWYKGEETKLAPMMQCILSHSLSGIILTARVYITNAAAAAEHHETFQDAQIILEEAKKCISFTDDNEYANEIRFVEMMMGFSAIARLGAISGTLASVFVEDEQVKMIRDFVQAGHYNLAAKAVAQYMKSVDYITRPTKVGDVLELIEAIGAKSGNNVYMWTTRQIALASTPLQAHIALGRQGVWCRTFLDTYSDTGSWELLKRFAAYYGMYYYKIGDLTQLLHWTMVAHEYDSHITNDPGIRMDGVYRIFTFMVLRLGRLSEEDAEGELEGVQEYGVAGFRACEEAGFTELSQRFLTRLSSVGIVPETLLGASEEDVSFIIAPLGDPQNLDSEGLLALYIKQRDLLDRLLVHDHVARIFELYDQLEAYLEPLYKLLHHGMSLKLRAVDFAMIQNALGLRLAQGIMACRSASIEQRERAFQITKQVAARCADFGELHTQRETLFVAAQWAYQLKQPNWGKVVMDFLCQAEDCMDKTRAHLTAVSKIDSLDNKQQLVANFGRSDVYTFGYLVLVALNENDDPVAILSAEDKVTTYDVWRWTQRGKARSIMDLMRVGISSMHETLGRDDARLPSNGENPATEAGGTTTATAATAPASDHKPETADTKSEISLENVHAMAKYFAEQQPDCAMVFVDWFIGSDHIDMIVVDAAGDIHTEVLDFTLENALKTFMRIPYKLRCDSDVKAWKDQYLGSDFLSDVLTEAALAELDWLVEPLQKYSKPGDLLVFCPSGVLHGLPLHSLSVEQQCLLERNPVVYTGSLSLLFDCYNKAKTRDTSKSDAAVFGVYGKSGHGDVEKSAEETRVEDSLKLISSSLQAKVEYGVSPDAFIQKCRDHHIIHYHGHAIMGRAKQDSFGQSLVLSTSAAGSNLLHSDEAIDDSLLLGGGGELGTVSNSGRLTAREMISRLQLSSAHVTLIACNSASQVFSAGDEPQGIIPVLLLCGATSVLGTLWPILSADGRRFSETFYRSFGKAGEIINLAKSVQRSVLAIKAAHPEPIHWAGFVLHGAWFHKF